jgi:CheY-like chemotaxis protein
MNEKSSSRRPFNVLLVEDDDDDVLLTRHAFEKVPVAVDLQVARDGVEALELLRGASSFSNAALPDIILLDLNMPRMDGRHVLAELKKDNCLKMIPTVVLTTSAAEDDVKCAYSNHASAYITKPMDLEEFGRRTRRLVDFWLSDVVTLPCLS